MPADVSYPQQVQIVRNFVAANPTRWGETGPVLIRDALEEAYSCKK